MASQVPQNEREQHYGNPDEGLSASIIGINIALPIVATIAVVLRLGSQRLNKNRWKADDSVLVVGLLVTYALCVEFILGAHFGMGNQSPHTSQNPQSRSFTNILKMQFAIEMTWPVCTYPVKLSNILLLLHFLNHPSTLHSRICLHFSHAFLFLWTTASFFIALFRCAPIESVWNLNIHGSCSHSQTRRILPAALNLLTDLVLLCLTLRIIWQLRLSLKQKLAVLIPFCIGLLCLAASSIRLNQYVVTSTSIAQNPIYMNARFVVWTSVESCAGVVCACLPTLRPLSARVHIQGLSGWSKNRFSAIFSCKEPDTWWHPPPEELEKTDTTASSPTRKGTVDSDWNIQPTPPGKVLIRQETVYVNGSPRGW